MRRIKNLELPHFTVKIEWYNMSHFVIWHHLTNRSYYLQAWSCQQYNKNKGNASLTLNKQSTKKVKYQYTQAHEILHM